LTVYARPVAGFNVPSKLYKGYPITFNASAPYSYDPDGTIINYTWDFGDGNITSVSNSTIPHTYLNNDTYTVKLTVTDNDNLSNSATKNITIKVSSPKAVFSITSPRPWPGPYYVNETLTFDATNSTPDGGSISGYIWDFGDGTEGNGSVIDHSFKEPGIYNVILTVFDEKGLIDIEFKLMRISPFMQVKPETIVGNPPDEIIDVNITIAGVEKLKTFSFNLTWAPYCALLSYYDKREGDFLKPGGILRWVGSITNGTCYVFATYTAKSGYEGSGSGTLLTIRLKVLSSGNATLKLKDTMLRNSTGKIDHSVINGAFYTTKPVANFTYSPCPATVNVSVTFDASSSYDPDGGNIVEYRWDFGDSNVTSVSNPTISHTYTQIKVFNVNLTVIDDDPIPNNWSFLMPVNVVGHDVAVVSVIPWANRTGWILPINVTVRNEEGASETFNVTLYYCNATGSYLIAATLLIRIPSLQTYSNPTTINLAPYSEKTLTIIWNVTCVALGNYTIKAVACTVPYEKHTGDNNCTSALKVAVIWLGNLDVDGDVDEDDLWQFCAYFITYYKSGYKPDEMIFIDFNFDGKIDEDDLWKFCEGFIDYYKRH
jgi:PKD repeat protein